MIIMLSALSKEKIISQNLYNNIRKVNDIRNKIAHGEYLNEDERREIRSHLVQNSNFKGQLYEDYTIYCISKLILADYEIVVPSTVDNFVVSDVVLQSTKYPNIIFEVKVIDHVSIKVVRKLEKVLQGYNELTNKKNLMILLSFRDKKDTLEVVSRDKEYDELTRHSNITIIDIPYINTNSILERIQTVVNTLK